jgi:tRNA A-37 threonylcarbamoyl transferase component Bud32
MSELRTCPQCDAPLPTDAPDGLCPNCLLRMGFESRDDPPADSAHRPTQYQPRSLPPSIEELAAKFPQLDLFEQIGQGGMGVVYKARQKDLDRVIALKILRPDIESDPAFSERFVREARALAKLSHPAIVTVHDFGRIDGFYYFIMEYVEGANLRELERSGKLEPRTALAIVPRICEALQYAHDQGVVHRDIKPENILIDKQGRVKIADFGLAKMIGAVPDGSALTGAWQVMGTPQYMAPEQMQGAHHVDHRADIYSLGVVIYEMLTGELPIGRFPLPSQKALVDVRLDEVVLKALEHEPERRYQRVSEVQTDMESIGGERGPDQKPSTGTAPEVNLWNEFSETFGLLAMVFLAFLLILFGLGLAGVGGTALHEMSAEKLKLGTEVRGSWVFMLRIVGAVVVIAGAAMLIGWYPTSFALLGIGMWLWESPWILAGLGLPWFALGLRVLASMRTEREGGSRKDGSAIGLTAQVALSFLASLALVVYAIFLNQSAWPLLGLISVVAGVFAAECVGWLKKPRVKEAFASRQPNGSGSSATAWDTPSGPSAPTQPAREGSISGSAAPADAPGDPASGELAVSATPRSNSLLLLLLSTGSFVLIGFTMWITQSVWGLLALTVPWFFLSFADDDEEHFPRESLNWVLTICGLETLGLIGFGTWLDQSAWPLVTIIWVLLVFAFGAHPPEDEETDSEAPSDANEGENADSRPDTSTSLLARIQALFGRCWRYCAEHHPGPTRVVLLVMYVAAFILFFSVAAKTERPNTGPPDSRFETTVGFPFPWFEHWSQKGVGGETRVNLLTPAWLFVVVAFTALHLALPIRPSHVPVNVWERPIAHAVIWFLFALAAVLQAFVMEVLFTRPEPHYFPALAMIAIWLVLAFLGIRWVRRTQGDTDDDTPRAP